MYYCYDDLERFDNLYNMLESLELIGQLSEGVVYYTTEPQIFKASALFRTGDILDLVQLVEDRGRIHNHNQVGVEFKQPYNKKTLAESIQRLLDEQMICHIIKEKGKIYKSITKPMIDEFMVKYLK